MKNYNIAFLLIQHNLTRVPFSPIVHQFPQMRNEVHSESENSNFQMYSTSAMDSSVSTFKFLNIDCR